MDSIGRELRRNFRRRPSAALQFGAAATFTGTYTGTGGGQFDIGAGDLSIGSGGATFDFPAGFLQWQPGGRITATAGTLTNIGDMTATSSPPASAGFTGTLDNTGTITLEGSGNFIGGTINNESGARRYPGREQCRVAVRLRDDQ